MGDALAALVDQLRLDGLGDLVGLVRRQSRSLDGARKQLFGKGPRTARALDGDAGGQALPEDQIAHLAFPVIFPDQPFDQADEFLFADVLLLAQSLPGRIGDAVGFFVGEPPLNQVVHEHSPHEGNALFTVDDRSHSVPA